MVETILREKLDITPIILLTINLIILIIMFNKGVEGAGFYFNLAFFFVFALVILTFWYKSQNIVIKKSPFSKTTTQGSSRFVLGALAALIILNISTILKSLQSPFFLYSTTQVDTFLAGQFRTTEWIISAVSAGIIEELIFGVAFMYLGFIVADFILGSLGTNLNNRTYLMVTAVIASLFSVFLFTIFHTFNPVYGSTFSILFVMAALFRFVMNIIAWLVFDINFTIGWHIVNNTIFLGASTFFGAITTGTGLVIVALFGVMVMYTIRLIMKKGVGAFFQTALGRR